MISIASFALLFIVGWGFFGWNMYKIRSNILLGREIDRSGNRKERIRTMVLVALGQRKMFTRPIPALLHLAVYSAFMITQIELVEIFLMY